MGKITLEKRNILTKPQKIEFLSGLVDANGSTLGCSFFADKKIKIPFGRPDYDNQKATPREDSTETRPYSAIREISNKAKDYFNRVRMYLTNISRYLLR